ncbi:hypothetical protein [Polyangium fumosum]|uniref:Uncharacterized protein n=1 Tax=Polyangium fumosum TaxID=889272 RepID=A0A4V5PPA4_9BACT|nr:hypothetical protein [Polyangium fumosum]TKD03420.1 hypothetical protein E8A74_26005 [Polyangium fumosum]
MKMMFTWTSTHERLEVRFILLSAVDVQKVRGAGGNLRELPVVVGKGEEISIDPNDVPYGTSKWVVRVFLADVTGTPMEGLDILCDGKLVIASKGKVEANSVKDFEETITNPPGGVA